MATTGENSIFRQESHAHTKRYSDGSVIEHLLSELENSDREIQHVGIVDHISPKDWEHLYQDAERDERFYIENGEDIRSRSRQLEWANLMISNVEINRGAEIDSVPGIGWTKKIIEKNKGHLDYAHVSHHFYQKPDKSLVSYKDGDFSDIDNVSEKYFGSFEKTLTMLEDLEADIPIILSHPGLPENNPTIQIGEERLREGYENILEIVDALGNIYPELNLKTEERVEYEDAEDLEKNLEKDDKVETTVWANTLLEYGTEFTLGTDNHRTHETDARLRLGQRILDSEDVGYAVPVQELSGWTVGNDVQTEQP